jgi:hypothetical protein
MANVAGQPLGGSAPKGKVTSIGGPVGTKMPKGGNLKGVSAGPSAPVRVKSAPKTAPKVASVGGKGTGGFKAPSGRMGNKGL